MRERQGALAGQIRLTAPTGFGSTRLSEALVPFLRKHPDVEVDMRLTDHRLAWWRKVSIWQSESEPCGIPP